MVVQAPARLRHDLAGFLVRDRRVIIPAAGDGVDQRRAGKGLIFQVEVAYEREINNGLACPIQVNANMALFGIGGPDPPNAAGSFHFSQHQVIAFFANDALTVPVGIPIHVLATSLVVAALAIVAGELGALFILCGHRGEVLKVRQPFDQVEVCELLTGSKHRGANERE